MSQWRRCGRRRGRDSAEDEGTVAAIAYCRFAMRQGVIRVEVVSD